MTRRRLDRRLGAIQQGQDPKTRMEAWRENNKDKIGLKPRLTTKSMLTRRRLDTRLTAKPTGQDKRVFLTTKPTRKIKARCKAYREANRETHLAWLKTWRQNNKEARTALEVKRNASNNKLYFRQAI